VVLTYFAQGASWSEEASMDFYVYENWVRDKAMVHRADSGSSQRVMDEIKGALGRLVASAEK
jgi:hypothetical protein